MANYREILRLKSLGFNSHIMDSARETIERIRKSTLTIRTDVEKTAHFERSYKIAAYLA